MKRLISARMNEIEKAFLRLLEGRQCISIYFPKITILSNAYEWGKQRGQVPAVTSRSFGLVIVDTESKKILCAIDFGFEDVPDQDLKRAVCRDLEVPYFVISVPSDVVSCKQEIMQERRVVTVLGYGGRLNKHQYLTSMAFSLPEGRHGLGAHVLSEMSISSLIPEEEFSHIVSKVAAEFADWDWRRDRDYLYQMDVDAVIVLGKPYSVPLFGFEYDGVSHGATEWSVRKDRIKRELFKVWGVPLISLSSGGHAPGLVENPKGRLDLAEMCSQVTSRFIKDSVCAPDFLDEIAGLLDEEAVGFSDIDLKASFSGLARLLNLIKEEVKYPYWLGRQQGEEEINNRVFEPHSYNQECRWIGAVSPGFLIYLEDLLQYSYLSGGAESELYFLLTSPVLEKFRVSEEVLSRQGGGNTYRLNVEVEGLEPDQSFRVERVDLKMAAGHLNNISQEWLDSIVLSAQRGLAFNKFLAWLRVNYGGGLPI